MNASTKIPGYDQIRHEEIARLFGSFVRLRALVTPLPLAFATYVLLREPSHWRWVLVGASVVTMVTLILIDTWRLRRHGVRRRNLAQNILAGSVALPAMLIVTGGIESPLLPAVVALSASISVFLANNRARLAAVVLQLAVAWLLAAAAVAGWVPDLLPDLFGGGSHRHTPVHLVAGALFVSMMVCIVTFVAARVRDVVETMLRRSVESRDEMLRLHADQAELLTTLSAEIAHELKNPLASVKGLAALVAKEVAGKNAERLTVLRREADRMQTILDEFLDFSRPLVALSQEEVALEELCRNVALLYEGLGYERGVALRVAGDGHGDRETRLRCDPRKVRQILINLLQNAIEASGSPGTTIEVDCRAEGEQVTLTVSDRGAGLAAAIEGRAFEPGVTSKAKGSGLGLTVARSLARQHGGELALRPRDGGGCIAELTLPQAAGVGHDRPAAGRSS